jgi:hypothetical protein
MQEVRGSNPLSSTARFHISSVSIFTFGSDNLASAWDDLVRGGVRAWCGWLAWVRACRTAVVAMPGENRLVSSGAGWAG